MLDDSGHSSVDVALRLTAQNKSDHLASALQILQPHIPRITVLSIDSPYIDQLVSIFHSIVLNDPPPPLEILALVNAHGTGQLVVTDYTLDQATGLKEIIRALDSVRLEGVMLPPSLVDMFHGLRHLRLFDQLEDASRIASRSLRRILQSSPTLETLEMQSTRIIMDETRDDDDDEPIDMHSLYMLSMTNMISTELDFLLRTLHAPILRMLTLADPEPPKDRKGRFMDKALVQGLPRDQNLLKALTTFLSPLCRLESLCIRGLDLAPPNGTTSFIRVLETTPFLQTLELADIELEDTVLKRMGILPEEEDAVVIEPLCPALRTLALVGMESFTASALRDMVASRSEAPGRKLEVLKLAECEYDEKLWRRELEALVGLLMW